MTIDTKALRKAAQCVTDDHTSGILVLGIRHGDAIMHMHPLFDGRMDQGFIDNRGGFLTRVQAWKVAKAAGQIIRRVGGDDANGGTLFSESLY